MYQVVINVHVGVLGHRRIAATNGKNMAKNTIDLGKSLSLSPHRQSGEGSRANSVQLKRYLLDNRETSRLQTNVAKRYLTSRVCSSMSRLRSVLLNLSRRAGDFPRVVPGSMPLPPALGHPPTHIQLEKMIRVAECLEDQL